MTARDTPPPAGEPLPPESDERAALLAAGEHFAGLGAHEPDAPEDEVVDEDPAEPPPDDDDDAPAATVAEPPPLPQNLPLQPLGAGEADRFVAAQVAHQLGDWFDRAHIDLPMGALQEAMRTRGSGFVVWDAAANRIVMAHDPGGVVFDGTQWRRREGASAKFLRLAAVLNDLRPLARQALYCIDMEKARGPGKLGTQTLPVFQYHRRPFARSAILWPLFEVHEIGQTAFLGKHRPLEMRFRRKEAGVIWRGSLSGTAIVNGQRRSSQKMLDGFAQGLFPPPKLRRELRHIPRFHLCEQARAHDFIDIGFVLEEREEALRHNPVVGPLVRDRIPHSRWLRYRYLLQLEGWDVSKTLYWGLNSNSVVFKQDYCWETFADIHFQPWVHYVPVKPELGDIEFKFHWCEDRLPMCERISVHARHACRLLGMPELREQALREVVQTYEARFRRLD